MNPFEHVKNLHTKKRRWEDFNDEEKKAFNVYIINKTLSFNPNYLDIVSITQKYSTDQISQKEVFNIFVAKIGIVLTFIVLLVPDKAIAAIARFCESKIGAPTP